MDEMKGYAKVNYLSWSSQLIKEKKNIALWWVFDTLWSIPDPDSCCFLDSTLWSKPFPKDTLPKFNMEPEDDGF